MFGLAPQLSAIVADAPWGTSWPTVATSALLGIPLAVAFSSATGATVCNTETAGAPESDRSEAVTRIRVFETTDSSSEP